jgi:putative Mn2+ efflux pump MntP
VSGSTLKLIGLVVPLGLDTLGVALALGVAGLPRDRRLRLSLWFAGFEAAMPLIGVALGAPLGQAVGAGAEYGAAALIAVLGVYLLVGAEHDDSERLLSLTRGGFAGALLLGLGISLDELAIGFSAGLLRLPVGYLVAAVAAQAFLVTQVGLRVGARAAAALRGPAERLAGLALLALACVLLADRLAA